MYGALRVLIMSHENCRCTPNPYICIHATIVLRVHLIFCEACFSQRLKSSITPPRKWNLPIINEMYNPMDNHHGITKHNGWYLVVPQLRSLPPKTDIHTMVGQNVLLLRPYLESEHASNRSVHKRKWGVQRRRGMVMLAPLRTLLWRMAWGWRLDAADDYNKRR